MILKSTSHPTVGIAILTLNAASTLPYCLTPLLMSPLKPQILIIDSSSTDDTLTIAKQFGIETKVIEKADFNHGETRELARQFLQTDIIVMITPDAYAKDEFVLGKLIEPIIEGKASVAYARQVPHKNAGFFEAFPREFNYPENSHIRSIEDLNEFGIYTFFCSDSFAAYSNTALNEINGFPTVLLGEDTLVVAKLLRKKYRVAYVAEAVVHHSHKYTIVEEFKRYFDTGLARAEYGHWLHCGQKDSGRGHHFVGTLMRRLMKKPQLFPYAFVQTLAKWTGYRLGKMCVNAPVWVKQTFSSQKFYWTSKPFLKQQKEKSQIKSK